MRAHARVEDSIAGSRSRGRLRFTDIAANRAWLAVVCFADALVRWFQQLCLTGRLSVVEPKGSAGHQGAGATAHDQPVPGDQLDSSTNSVASTTAAPGARRRPGRRQVARRHRRNDAADGRMNAGIAAGNHREAHVCGSGLVYEVGAAGGVDAYLDVPASWAITASSTATWSAMLLARRCPAAGGRPGPRRWRRRKSRSGGTRSRPWERRCSMSAHASPPPASMSMA